MSLFQGMVTLNDVHNSSITNSCVKKVPSERREVIELLESYKLPTNLILDVDNIKKII